MKPLFALLTVFLLVSGASGCGEQEQVVVYKQGKYQGKPDSRPWDNDPLAVAGAGKWTKGDQKGWETQIKARQLGQHEDKRIYQQ